MRNVRVTTVIVHQTEIWLFDPGGAPSTRSRSVFGRMARKFARGLSA